MLKISKLKVKILSCPNDNQMPPEYECIQVPTVRGRKSAHELKKKFPEKNICEL